MKITSKPYLDKDFLSGIKDSSPICIAFMFMCVSFGGLAKISGFSLIQTMSMAMLIYSIPLQVFLLSLTKGNLTLTTIVTLTFVMNARFFLMSLSLMHYFKQMSLKKTIPAMLMLSASSFTVSHVKFSSVENIGNPFNYYFGVALSAYVVTFISTLAGFYLAFINDNVLLNHVFSMSLAIHFTALTAIRFPNIRFIFSTILGFIMLMLLSTVMSINISVLLAPFLAGSIIFMVMRWSSKA